MGFTDTASRAFVSGAEIVYQHWMVIVNPFWLQVKQHIRTNVCKKIHLMANSNRLKFLWS